ncbi:MAG: ABC transporter permease [Eubacteriales bacterium]|jgi:general nucleoside transport system permease protein|nr:ABC transporter permease [Eubacteriales bacterium]
MDIILIIIKRIFSVAFIQKAVTQGIPILYGASGEIITERSGNLNLGIPGIMYMGAVGGLAGSFIYEQSVATPNGWVGVICALIVSILFSLIGGLIYSVLTITLRVNQNVTGLALTTFGVGFGNFLGGSLSRISGTAGQVSVYATGQAFRTKIPFLSEKLGIVSEIFFSYGFLTYLSIILSVFLTWFLFRTRRGLNLRAVGEDPAAADAAGINVIKYKYAATCSGAVISGLGGLYFVMEYLGGTWQNNGFGDRGWLAIALVILALWKPARAIWGCILFGGLYILFAYVPLGEAVQEIFKMLPYVVTIIVLILSSIRGNKDNQAPKSLGLSYFREDR